MRSEDELGRLARTFNEMCASIRQAREDLIRQERISTIGRLSGSIVHDLRNPLAAIYGGAEMLVDADLPPAQVKRLAGNHLSRVAAHAGTAAGSAQCLARQGQRAGGVPPARSGVGCVRTLAVAAGPAGVTMALEIPAEIEVPAGAQPYGARILQPDRQRAGGDAGRRRGSHLGGDAGWRSLVVHVADTGPGIAPEIRAQLFQPFVSAGKRNGLGLGLALARQTVLDHGGDMWVESAPGRGARFSFRLPGAHLTQAQGLAVGEMRD